MYSDDTTVPLYITPPKSLVVFMPWYASTPRGVLLQILAVLAADAGILVLSRVYTTVVFACAFAVDFDWISRVGVGGRIWVQVWARGKRMNKDAPNRKVRVCIGGMAVREITPCREGPGGGVRVGVWGCLFLFCARGYSEFNPHHDPACKMQMQLLGKCLRFAAHTGHAQRKNVNSL